VLSNEKVEVDVVLTDGVQLVLTIHLRASPACAKLHERIRIADGAGA